MGATTGDGREAGVEFVFEDDGRVTARDVETDVASFGESKVEALVNLAEALALHRGDGSPVDESDLREMGLDPDAEGDESIPGFLA